MSTTHALRKTEVVHYSSTLPDHLALGAWTKPSHFLKTSLVISA